MLDAGVGVDRGRLAALTARRRRPSPRRARARGALAERARGSLLGGVPMTWMMRWAGPYPLFLAEAKARVVDVDGHEYVDLCLGDTGAMAGHAPEPVVRAVAERAAAGLTAMLPTEDAAWAARSSPAASGCRSGSSRSRPPTRTASRSGSAARSPAGRRSSSSTAATTARSTRRSHPARGRLGRRARGQRRPAGRPALTTKVVELNDVDALEAALAPGDVAACSPSRR